MKAKIDKSDTLKLIFQGPVEASLLYESSLHLPKKERKRFEKRIGFNTLYDIWNDNNSDIDSVVVRGDDANLCLGALSRHAISLIDTLTNRESPIQQTVRDIDLILSMFAKVALAEQAHLGTEGTTDTGSIEP